MLKALVPKSLYARVVWIVILPIFLMQSFVTWIFFERHWDQVSANLSASMASQIALVTQLYEEAPDARARAQVEALSAAALEMPMRFEVRAQIPERDITSPFSMHSDELRELLDASLDEAFSFNTRRWPNTVEIYVQTETGRLVFLPRRDRVFATNGRIFVLWLVSATLLLGWIAIMFLKNQVRSILHLAEAAEAFGRGRDMPQFRPSGATEVRKAGRVFLAMRERIRRHLHQRTAMLAGLSHDLRTPLTRLKLALAMQPETTDMQALRADVAEMERMVESYLSFARDVSAIDAPERLDASVLVRECAAEAVRAGGIVEVEAQESPLPFVGQRDAFRRAVGNLLENARKYASRAWLTARRSGDFVEILVEDDGPGVAPDQYEEAFKPFVRLEEGRNLNASGVGLGLSIVREVARGLGGEALLDQSPHGGLRAILRAPLADTAPERDGTNDWRDNPKTGRRESRPTSALSH